MPDDTGCLIRTSVGPSIHWEAWDIPTGDFSLPRELTILLRDIRAEHATWAYDIAHVETAGRTVAEWLTGGDTLSMWWCSLLYERHPKMTPALYTIYKLRTLERLLLRLEKQRSGQDVFAISLCGGDRLLAQTIANLCEEYGWGFTRADGGSQEHGDGKGLLRRCYDAVPPLLRATARFVHWYWKIWRTFTPVTQLPMSPLGKTATIATYFPNVDMDAAKAGRFRSRYWESLHDALAPVASGIRWLFVRFPAPQMTLEQCIAFRDRLAQQRKDGLSFVWIEECLKRRDMWVAIRRFLRLRAASLRIEDAVHRASHFRGSKLRFWPYIREDYAESFRGWRCLERCLQARGLDNYVRMTGEQRWTLFPLENCPWERMLTHAVHTAAAGPVYGVQHSTIRPTDFRYFDDERLFSDVGVDFVPDAICGNGRSACDQWRECGVPESRLGQMEALRYLYLAKDAAERTATSVSAPPRELLVLTSFFRDETFAHLALLARAAQEGLLHGWDITLKAHPYLPAQELLQHFPGEWSKDIRIADGGIAPLLKPGVLVWAANSTTAALEAALKGLPVMVMQPSGDFDLCPMQDIPGLIRTATVDDVKKGLEEAIPLEIPGDYLLLDKALPAWRRLLDLPQGD